MVVCLALPLNGPKGPLDDRRGVRAQPGFAFPSPRLGSGGPSCTAPPRGRLLLVRTFAKNVNLNDAKCAGFSHDLPASPGRTQRA